MRRIHLDEPPADRERAAKLIFLRKLAFDLKQPIFRLLERYGASFDVALHGKVTFAKHAPSDTVSYKFLGPFCGMSTESTATA